MTLAFFDAGAGAPPLVLIHGWTCDHSAMAPVADAFKGAHLCRSVDLLGHGGSPGNGDLSISAQARALLDVTPENAILIGHSMGAQVALEAAVQAPGLIKGVVLLDPAQIVPHEGARGFMAGLRDKLARGDVAEVLIAFARRQFLQPTDPSTADHLLHVMVRTDPAVARTAWDAIMTWDGRTALERAACPLLLVTIDKPSNFLVDMARVNPKLMTAQVAGSGHMLQFEVMDQAAAMIRRWLTLNSLA